ncbi:murein biosynthesis integral membrane protein MurJ [Actinocorallia longicatena]|uniref:Lipid II flippase MurJ n=1 Tax=Actinocorallia longicatena TaxID=111803 RepID=A0ABP6QCY2_9ACTN
MNATLQRFRRDAILRATLLSGSFIAAGTALGFLRDLTMAHLFGASGDTDAFLVAWTIPETVSPLLIEDAMALLMVPAVTRAVAEHGSVRPLIRATLPRLSASLVAVMLATAWLAPQIAELLAPGLPQHDLATTCMRYTSAAVACFGLAGYMSATLRAHEDYGPPSRIYLAYNIGILAAIATLHSTLGVVAAALGVAIGGLLMVGVQLPSFLRRVRVPAVTRGAVTSLTLLSVVPIVAYTLSRQAQVFVERFFGSSLAAGSLSHLNYAQKIAQVPMVASLLIVTVTFPKLARSSVDGDHDGVRRRVEADLLLVGALVLSAIAFLVALAPTAVELLFEHGRFSGRDTAATALCLRVYSLGLLGQAMIGVLARAFFADGARHWKPAAGTGCGLIATAVVAALTVGPYGAIGLALANAVGISVAAGLLFWFLRSSIRVSAQRVLPRLAGLILTAAGASAAGYFVSHLLPPSAPALLVLVVGAAAVAAVFGSVTTIAGLHKTALARA